MKKFAAHYMPILLVFAVETLALDFAARSSGRPVYQTVTIFSAIVGAAILVTGLLPALVRPSNVHSVIACFTIVFGSLLLIPFELSELPKFQPPIPTYRLLTPHLLLRLLNGAVLMGMAIHLSARFPRLNSKISNRFLAAGYLVPFFVVILFLLSASAWLRIMSASLLFLDFTFVILFFFWNLLLVARDTTPENIRQAQQARIILVSLALAETTLWLRPLVLTIGFVIPYDAVLATQLFIPAGIAYAVLRHELFGIDRALRRALIYGALSLALLTIYLGLSSALTVLLEGYSSRPLAPLFSLLIAAALFEPARRWTQAWLDRLLYPDRLKFISAIQSVGTSLARANRRDEIASLLTSDLPRQIGAEWASLSFFPEADVSPTDRGAPAWSARLIAGNVVFGSYWLGPRRAGPYYDTEERSRLQTLIQQAALALAYANAYESLYELNQNLEARVKEQTAHALESQKEVAAYEERQRIARELHDSVTQDIFGLHLTARGLRKSTPEPLKKELGELENLASDVLRQMRLLLNQLRNPSGGEIVNLTEAIRSQCEALARKTGPEGGPLLTVEAELPEALEIPAAIAEEALWVVREALQNVTRHSHSRSAKCVVRADEMLSIRVEDAGKGFDLQAVPVGHYGLRGMRERVLTLGGEFKIDSEIGRGTILSFSLPLPK